MTVVKLRKLEELKRQIDALDNVVRMCGGSNVDICVAASAGYGEFTIEEKTLPISGELRDQICNLLQAERDRKRKEFEEA